MEINTQKDDVTTQYKLRQRFNGGPEVVLILIICIFVAGHWRIRQHENRNAVSSSPH